MKGVGDEKWLEIVQRQQGFVSMTYLWLISPVQINK